MSNIANSRAVDTVERAAEVLTRGGLIGLPTETVYGLAGSASCERALSKIFEVKGRPAGHPLILHLASLDQLDRYTQSIPQTAMSLIEACWPGPLTVLLQRSNQVSDLITGNRHTVAIRIPANECARSIIAMHGHAVAAPSANRFGHVSPTTAQHVFADLGENVDIIVDDGPCSVGVESTIIDFTTPVPQLLRPGGFALEDLEELMGIHVAVHDGESRASGMLESHYAPKGKVQLVDSFPDAVSIIAAQSDARLIDHWDNLPLYAASLYAQMRQADVDGVQLIVAIKPAVTGLGRAIRDRLNKASHP
jgi:L-threonylcarbamoyladenylate synthase